ncbi:hypothetical protein Poli38472_012175 [Pythium oligandrum]|uniref:TRAF3-interacting protein 1 n=1 Tax=Pythium oligandrum TaxID=41045 RepID=A0A8K1CP62_PYTOL|nr:hypothetical protein Poli38472_012175 [Pythium oligandrum]|eukprot:TMW67059.1 hypothetical protein Poli38472_012175 [Pythium oligandrum]
MADATLEALIPKTQELLQPLIAKPKLADKLLAKPPFRFLHDIFTALTQGTGFGKGLFNDFELDSANIKEKNQKIAYLDKMIVCVGACLGKEVDVRAAKIVAGLEPENTNRFLQDLATSASNTSLDWNKAVQKTLDKAPSLLPDGSLAVTGGGGSAPPAAEAKQESSGSSRPSSKEKPSSTPEAEKAAAAAAEAKAKERARREKEKEEAERRDKEAKAAVADTPKAESKRPPPDNNAVVDDAMQQQIRECNTDFERTKEVLEKIITKPKMAVKLLSKPPFRFLHDIVSEVTRVTSFADGLYTAQELDSNSIKEKQPKIDYLTKIISCASCHLNVEIEARPAKIVAGLEPEETSRFLQLLAVACKYGGSSADAVQRVLSGDTALRTGSAGSKKPPAPKSAERDATPEAKLSSRSTTPQESKSRTSSSRDVLAEAAKPSVAPGSFASSSAPMKAVKTGGDDDDEQMNLRFPAATNDAKGTDGDDDRPMSTAPGTSGGLGTSRTSRPTTARRRPPKLKENVTEVGRSMVPDAKVAPVVGLMKDGDNADSDDDAQENNKNDEGSRPSSGDRPTKEMGGAHGRLVRDLLKDEEAARKQKEDEDTKDGPTALETETGIRLGRRTKSFKDKSKSVASSATEMNELRQTIQKLCQATLPLGKSIEFVHEDLDAMSKELEHWKKEYESKCAVYEDERKKTEEALQPLQLQLLEVEEQIKEQVHKIHTLKATIAKNDDKTQKLLRMVVSA